MIVLSGNVSFEFLGTLRSADGSAVISHNLRIGMHHRECFAMSITPSVKSKARRFDHFGVRHCHRCFRRSDGVWLSGPVLRRKLPFRPTPVPSEANEFDLKH
jgi:hypothetical protein